jgi:hypothetical protein
MAEQDARANAATVTSRAGHEPRQPRRGSSLTLAMKKILLATFFLFTVILHAAAERPTEFYDPDVQRLLQVNLFAFGGIGVGGRTSEGEDAFGAIVRKKEAIRFILAVFEYGGDHAKCYALVALRESSPQLFRESIARLRKNPPKEITMMSGCLMSHPKPEKVLAAIEAGSYATWFKHHEEKKG